MSDRPIQRPLQLMLVDEDPVFRLGLKVWLEQQRDFAVVAEAGDAAEVLAKVSDLMRDPNQLDLLILDLGLGAQNPAATPGLELCQQLKAEFPNLPILVLSAQNEPVIQAAAERMGADGYGTRSMSVRHLADLIRKVSRGEASDKASDKASSEINSPVASAELAQVPSLQTVAPDPESLPTAPRYPPQSRPRPAELSRLTDIPGPLTAMRISMRLSGQRQIDQELSVLTVARQQTSSWLKQTILDGKRRELKVARKLVSAIWRTPQFSDAVRANAGRPPRHGGLSTGRNQPLNQPPGSASTDWIRMASGAAYDQSYADRTAARYLDRELLVSRAVAIANQTQNDARNAVRLQAGPDDVQTIVFENVFAKLQQPLKNISESPLEIDILRPDKKLELLYLVLRQLETLLTDLRASQVKPGQISTRATQVIHDLWDAVNTEFFGKYYTVQIRNMEGTVEEEIVTLLQQEKPLVQAQILDRIPLAGELFGHWLFLEPMIIEGSSYDATTPQALAYSECLLENLTLQVANAVVQPLLNRLADSEPVKKSLYCTRLMSSREIERFRNDLSWRYRWDRLVNEPKAIFESRYNLYVLAADGIDTTAIYSPRRAELDRLGGIPLVVTLALETRDAIAPRLRTAFSIFGSSVVYVLTEVLGRGIGLVGRGILKGVGSAWQDTKGKPRNRQRPVYPEPPEQATPNQDYGQNYGQNTYPQDFPQDFSEWE